MAKDLFEDMLGPDAAVILEQAARTHPRLVSSQELEAVETYTARPKELTDLHKAALVDLLTAVADDFASRRRAELIRATQETPPMEEDDDLYLEDEDGNLPERRPERRARPPQGDEEGLEAFLDSLDDD